MKFLISVLAMRMDSGIEKCLAAIRRSGGDYRLHLTANGDPAVVKYMLGQRNHDDVAHVVVNAANLGFLAPNEAAFRYADGNGYDYLCMVNDDCLVPAGWLEQIEATFARHPAAAIVGGSGVSRALTSDFHGYLGRDLEYIECSAAAVRVSVIQKVAKTLFLPSLRFAYCEDACLSLEVQRRGYTIHQAPFTIEHSCGTTRKHVPEAAAAEEANRTVALARYSHWLRHRTFAHRIVVKRRASIGDVLLTTPVIRKLWEENPLCEIVVETDCPEVFAGNPCVSSAACDVGRMPTDRVISLDMVSEDAPMRHFVTSYARAAGVELEPPFKTEIYWNRDRFGTMDWPERWVALHTGPSTWRAKELRADKWNAIMEELRRDGWKVVLVGNGRMAGVDSGDRDFRDKTKTVTELAALLTNCDLFVGLDSAPLHIAQAAGVPVVGLFGITDSRYILTGGSPHIGLNADPTIYPRAGERHRIAGATMVHEDGTCINSITVDRVMDAVRQLAKTAVPV